MKNLQTLILFGSFCLLISCQSQFEKPGDFNLLPLPQQYKIEGTSKLNPGDIRYYYILGEINLPVTGDLLENIQPAEQPSRAQILCSIDTALDIRAEGYTLEISRNKIIITGKDRSGLLYAFMTLEQLMEDAKEMDAALPRCSIKDFPLLSYRAIHLDLKHHREKADYYYRILDKLFRYKVNAVIAEMEDKIMYESRPGIGSADALSISEWKKLSDYAKERNIEISPLIQGLGHASFILKHDRYKNLRDDPASDWAFNPLDPATYELQFDLYRDAMKATPYGRYLHVGGDEVHTTGHGSGKSPLELQLIWLNKVCKFAEEHGRISVFWDDMPLKHAGVYNTLYNPELTEQEVDHIWEQNEHKLTGFLDQFPKNCIYMRWNYQTPHAAGNIKAMEWFREHGMQVMGATAGQTRWVLMPQNESNMDNIKFFALTSINKDLEGLLLTLWDDDSPHFELYWRGIIAFAEYTWAGEKRNKEELKSAYRQREFSITLADTTYSFIDQLEKPVAFWNYALLKEDQRKSLRTLDHPMEAVIDFPSKSSKGEWSVKYAGRLEQAIDMLEDCEEIASKIETMKSHAVRNLYTLEVYEQVNNLVRFAPEALLALKAYDTAENDLREREALISIRQLPGKFDAVSDQLKQVYGVTRLLDKPEGYLLDQDHHRHLANQSISFDWQFYAELLFLEKIQKEF